MAEGRAAKTGIAGAASWGYVATTLVALVAWQAHVVSTLFRRAPGIERMMNEFGGELPWVTASFLSTYRYSPLLVLISAALCADVLRRNPIPQRYAAWTFGSLALASFALQAWLNEAFFAPIFAIDSMVR